MCKLPARKYMIYSTMNIFWLVNKFSNLDFLYETSIETLWITYAFNIELDGFANFGIVFKQASFVDTDQHRISQKLRSLSCRHSCKIHHYSRMSVDCHSRVVHARTHRYLLIKEPYKV